MQNALSQKRSFMQRNKSNKNLKTHLSVNGRFFTTRFCFFAHVAKFLHFMSFTSVASGLICGLLFLMLLDNYGLEILPDVFVDRKIPIHISARGLIISFIVPYAISLGFSLFSLGQFKKEANFLDHIRTIG